MTDQQPGGPGNSGSWQPVPGGGDYDPDQTMHVSFAAQLPPEPRPGEDPLSAHGPVGYQEHPGGPGPSGPGPDGRGDGGPADPEAVTSWSIPVIRDDVEPDSGEYSVGAFAPSWDEVPSPAAPTQSFPAGMFGQGAAAAAQARAAQAQGPQTSGTQTPDTQAPDTQAPETHGQGARMRGGAAGGDLGHLSGQWTTPFTGPEGGDAVPWLPAHAPAADAAWSGVVDDPDSPVDPGSAAYGHPGDETEPAADASAGYTAVADPPQGRYAPGEAAGPLPDAETAHPGTVDGLPGAHGFPATGGPAADGRGADAPGTDPYGADGFGADAHVPGAHAPDAQGPDGSGAHGGDAYADGGQDPEAFTDSDPPADALGFPADGRPGDPGDPADPAAPADPTDHDALAAADESAEEVFAPEPAPEPVEETRSEHPLASYMLRVNGTDRPVTDAWLGESLLYVLRERLGLAGAKDGCEQGECGACSVQVDGRLVASCLVPAATAAGSEVRTVEGLTVEGRPSDVQQALADCGAVQCGFCIPGMAMTVHDLLEGNHKPTELDVRQALSGNLCRCSGYRGVLDAVRQVVTGRETDDDPATDDDFVRVPHQGGPGQGGPGPGGPGQGIPGQSSPGQGIPGQGGPTGAAGGAL